MAEQWGNIYTLPELRLPYQDRKPSFVRTRATENCDFFGSLKPPAEETLKETPAEPLNPDDVRLAQKFGSLIEKIKKGIDSFPQKTEEGVNKLVDYKLKTLIQADTKYPVDVEHLSPKMKIAVLKLYNYAQKQGISFEIGQASRPEPQQEAMRNDTEIGKYAAKCSPHVQNIAIDIHILGKDLHDAQADLKKLGRHWKKLTGGRWGGDWYGKHHEPWHFDLKQKRQNLCLSSQNKNKTSEKV